jgi:general secretion pathway protein N
MTLPRAGLSIVSTLALLSPAPALAADVSQPLWRVPLQTLTATRDKPLFSPSRRPPPPAPVALPPPAAPPLPPPPPEPPPRGALVGVLTGPDNYSVAMIVPDQSSKPMQLHVGEKIGNWTMTSLEARAAVFQNGERREVMEMKTASGGGSGAIPMPAPGFPRPLPRNRPNFPAPRQGAAAGGLPTPAAPGAAPQGFAAPGLQPGAPASGFPMPGAPPATR